MRSYEEIAKKVKEDCPELKEFSIRAVISLWAAWSEAEYCAAYMLYGSSYIEEFRIWLTNEY